MKRLARTLRRFADSVNEKLPDIISAHGKLIFAAATALVPQYVKGDAADLLLIVLGLILTGAWPNDQAAIERIYKQRR